MNENLRALLARKHEKALAAKKFVDAAKAANREMTAEEATDCDKLLDEIEGIDKDIARVNRLIDAERGAPEAEQMRRRLDSMDTAAIAADPRHGFASFGEFAAAVMAASVSKVVDPRLAAVQAAAPATYGNEGNLTDGGYLIAPEFAGEVFLHSLEQDSLLALCDQYPVLGNALAFPAMKPRRGAPTGSAPTGLPKPAPRPARSRRAPSRRCVSPSCSRSCR
jgi:HK97 family phage major capsid protein